LIFTPLVFYAPKWAGLAYLSYILTYKWLKSIKIIHKIYHPKSDQMLIFSANMPSVEFTFAKWNLPFQLTKRRLLFPGLQQHV
jgi:hypothetical protein